MSESLHRSKRQVTRGHPPNRQSKYVLTRRGKIRPRRAKSRSYVLDVILGLFILLLAPLLSRRRGKKVR